MARNFSFITTGSGGSVQIDGGAIQYPVNKSGIVKTLGNVVSFRLGDIYDQVIVGNDAVNVDGVAWVGTPDAFAKKIQSIFTILPLSA